MTRDPDTLAIRDIAVAVLHAFNLNEAGVLSGQRDNDLRYAREIYRKHKAQEMSA